MVQNRQTEAPPQQTSLPEGAERDRLRAAARSWAVGTDGILKEQRDAHLPPQQRRTWGIDVTGDDGKPIPDERITFSHNANLAAVNHGLDIYNAARRDPKLRPHAKQMMREANEDVAKWQQELSEQGNNSTAQSVLNAQGPRI